MREIPLTRGKVALVDDEDYERLVVFHWQATFSHGRWRVQRVSGPRARRVNVVMARQILGVSDSKIFVDHINGDGLDNRRSNLRACTPRENLRNMHARRGGSGFKGVSYSKRSHQLRKPWAAQITLDRRHHHLGYFETAEEAARVYDAAARQHFGDFAQLNFPEVDQ